MPTSIRFFPLRPEDENIAATLAIESLEWAPQFRYVCVGEIILRTPGSLWFSALIGDELVGIIGFTGIIPPDGTAELALGVVHKWRGKGLATTIAKAQNQFAFSDLGLRRIQMIALTGSPSCKIASRAGLTLEGTLRKCRFKGGTYHDASIYALVKE